MGSRRANKNGSLGAPCIARQGAIVGPLVPVVVVPVRWPERFHWKQGKTEAGKGREVEAYGKRSISRTIRRRFNYATILPVRLASALKGGRPRGGDQKSRGSPIAQRGQGVRAVEAPDSDFQMINFEIPSPCGRSRLRSGTSRP